MRYDIIITDVELKSMLEDAAMACFNILFYHLCGGTNKKNMRNLCWGI
jgi:hypothetical protein